MTDEAVTELSSEWANCSTLYDRNYEEGEIFNKPWYKDLKEAILQGKDMDEFLADKDKKRYVAFLQYDNEIISIKKRIEEQEKDKQEALDRKNAAKTPEHAAREEELAAYHQRNIDNLYKKIENIKDEFEVPSEENACIRDFVAKNKDLLLNPPQMSDAEVKEFGLSQKYIEGVLLSSNYPDACFRSIRQFYEGLDSPAAPRLAYNGRASKARKGKDINPDDMVAKLREKGLDAVLATDERASDPHVFVVNHDSVFSPFLEPKDALKANVSIIEATRDLGGQPSLSNPMLRESMVRAEEPDKSKDLYNAQIDIYSKNKKHNPEQLSSYLQGITSEWSESKTSYLNLSNIVNTIQKKDPNLYAELTQNMWNKYNQLNSAGQWNLETAENLAQEILKNSREELSPYIFNEKQAEMANEAFELGEDAKELDRKSKEFISQHGYPESVFHAGKQGANPYAVLCSEKEGNMCMLYGAATVISHAENNERYNIYGDGCLGYAFGASSHTKRSLELGKYEFGFLYEYESRKEKQEMQFLDFAETYKGGKFDKKKVYGNHDETAILPHQNKLKKIYLALRAPSKETKIFPLELNEKGLIKDKKWRDFVEMYNPVNDNMSGKMVERQNNMIAEYDTNGKDNMYHKIQKLSETKAKENIQTAQSNDNQPKESLKTKSELKQTLHADATRASKVMSEMTEKTFAHTTEKIQEEIRATTPEVSNQKQVQAEVPQHSETGRNGIEERVSAINDKLDAKMEQIGNKLNDNAVGRKLENLEAWRPKNKAAAKVIDKVGVVPAAALVTGSALAYEQYKQTGDIGAAAETFGKSMKAPIIQGVTMQAGTHVAVKASEKVAEKVVERKAAKTVTKSAAKAAGKAAGKAVGKSVLKKIPLVSLGAGAYCAWDRVKNGEYIKAGGELLSGVAGCFPGVGTVVSTAIDCGLAASDVHDVIKENKKTAQTTPVPIKKSEDKTKKFLPKKIAELSGRINPKGKTKQQEDQKTNTQTVQMQVSNNENNKQNTETVQKVNRLERSKKFSFFSKLRTGINKNLSQSDKKEIVQTKNSSQNNIENAAILKKANTASR